MSANALAALLSSGRDRRRRPLEINRDEYPAANRLSDAQATATVDMDSLNADLRCPICLRLMREPVATECMHRFCKDCIEKCQRQGQKQCPSCRKLIVTRRALRPDPNIARLIARLYPDLDAFEAEEEEAMASNSRQYAESHLRRMQQQYALVRERQARMAAAALSSRVEFEQGASGGRGGGAAEDETDDVEDEEASDDDDDDDAEGDGEGGSESDEVEEAPEGEYETWPLEGRALGHGAAGSRAARPSRGVSKRSPRSRRRLFPRPHETGFRLCPHAAERRFGADSLQKDYLCVSSLARVQHIQMFLCQRLGVLDPQSFELHVVVPHAPPARLPSDMTLQQMVATHKLAASTLDLLFRYTSSV
jgi:hypothetical protein